MPSYTDYGERVPTAEETQGQIRGLNPSYYDAIQDIRGGFPSEVRDLVPSDIQAGSRGQYGIPQVGAKAHFADDATFRRVNAALTNIQDPVMQREQFMSDQRRTSAEELQNEMLARNRTAVERSEYTARLIDKDERLARQAAQRKRLQNLFQILFPHRQPIL